MQTGELDEIWKLTDSGLLKNISTLTCEYTEDYPVVSYGTDSITLQCSTSDGMNFHLPWRFDSAFRAPGVYEYHAAEYGDTFSAGAGDDRWEIMQKQFSNLLTYWKTFPVFPIRPFRRVMPGSGQFLKLDCCSHSREDDEIIH